MMNYNRLKLLYVALSLCLYNLKSQTNPDILSPQIVKDTFYGKVVEDPYRFLENTKDTVVDKWLHQQSDKSKNILRNLPNRETILAKQKTNIKKSPEVNYIRITNDNDYFYLKQGPNEKWYKLYSRKGLNGKEELLFDPKDFKSDSGYNYIINYHQPSWDGSKVAISFTKNDEEISELAVLDVKTKKLLPEVIGNCWPSELGGISWLKDNSGFYYLHIPVIDKSSKDYLLNTSSVLYKLDSDPKKLNVVFSARNNPEINIKPSDFPMVYFKSYYDSIIIGEIGGVSNFSDYYYSKRNSKGEISEWIPLYKKEDMVKNYTFNGKYFYFLSAKNSPNYKLCRTSINTLDFGNPEILVTENKDVVITDFAITKNEIYYIKNENGVKSRLYCLKDGKEKEIAIPKPSGFISFQTISPQCSDLWINLLGWTSYWTRYRYNNSKKIFVEEMLYPSPKDTELDDLVVEEIEISSYDEAKVPLSIVYKKGTKLNGNQRVFIDGYGAFGYSNRPYPNPYMLQWIRRGGIYALAHVRGGGEKGDVWYQGGFKQTKPNTWKDFIACTQHLIDKKYTNPDKIVIWGASGGGILIARAITERPDLYKAAIIYSGLINMLRCEFGPNGKNLIKEFGTVDDSIEFQALLEMDACQHIKKGIKYPAVLIQAGANDSRVPIWHSAKFAANLLAANASENPTLLSINYKGGHGINLSNDEWEQDVADFISFALWQTGHPDFQLKE